MDPVRISCLSCSVIFTDAVLHRDHCKGDWHRYNLKRRAVQLEPISKEDFARLEAQHRPSESSTSKDQIKFKCIPCNKCFSTKPQWLNHQQSNKHKAIAGEDSEVVEEVIEQPEENGAEEEDWEDVESGDEDGEPLETNACLFCPKVSSDMTENVKHMSLDHSFFIPDIEYLVDLEGLLDYLAHKIGIGKECLWCDDHKATVEGIQQHMMAKGHCKMNTEGSGLVEFSDFYDFSSSHPDSDSMDPSSEVSSDGELVVNDDLELVLPSGAKVGHRSLQVYYKQSLRSEEAVKKSIEARKNRGHEVVLQHYQLMGWQGSTINELKKKAKDHQFISRRKLKLQLKQNKLQTHFRAQILM